MSNFFLYQIDSNFNSLSEFREKKRDLNEATELELNFAFDLCMQNVRFHLYLSGYQLHFELL
jgi:hypothetical protein